MNTLTTLSTIQGWYASWDSTLTPTQDTDRFVYDDSVLLYNFQIYPWGSYTAFNSSPTLSGLIPTTLTTSYTVDSITISSGHIINHIFSDESEFSAWMNSTGDGPVTITDVSLVDGVATISQSDISSNLSKGFVTDKDSITFQTDDGNITYNFIEELGEIYVLTFDEVKYVIKFVFAGSGAVETSLYTGPSSGGDPHIIALGSNKVYDLPCKHGENYQYLAYKKHGESVVVNVMTQIVSFNAPKNKKLSKEIEEFISTCRDYVRYVYVCYTNEETGVKEEMCYDLFKLKCVSTNIKNFDTLAYNCRLPINKKSTKNLENIKLHKKVLKNRKVIGYKTNNKEEQFITVYTGSSKFDIMVGQAKNNLFGTYMSVEKYPQDVFVNGGGLLVHPTKTRPITCLKSEDNQHSVRKFITNKH